MRGALLILLVLTVVAAFRCASSASVSEYSMDMHVTSSDTSRSGKVYVSNNMVRVDTVDSKGRQLYTVMNLDSNLVNVVIPTQRLIIQRPLGPEDGLLVGGTARTAPRQLVGTEVVSGQDCEKFRAVSGRHTFFVWINKQTGVPVQVRSEDGRFRADYSNAVEGAQPQGLFELPSNYRKVISKTLPRD